MALPLVTFIKTLFYFGRFNTPNKKLADIAEDMR